MALVLLVSTALTPAASGADPTPDTSAEGERQTALGIARPDGRDLASLEALGASLDGRLPAIWVIWSQWGSPGTSEFPNELANELSASGITPMIWWEPVVPRDLDDPTYSRYRNILRGDHDDYIRRFARDARDYGGDVLLRFAHEPNSRYFPWSIERHDNSAARFVRAWRHVHGIFEEEGATNVRFVWSVARQRCPGGCNPYRAIYPGDAYVDVLGFGAHNWGAQRDNWVSLYDSAEKIAGQLGDISRKPLMMVEVASNAEGGDKATWVRKGYRAIHDRLPRVTAIVYLDADLRSVGHPDWRISSPPEALQALAEVAARPEFRTVPASPDSIVSD